MSGQTWPPYTAPPSTVKTAYANARRSKRGRMLLLRVTNLFANKRILFYHKCYEKNRQVFQRGSCYNEKN